MDAEIGRPVLNPRSRCRLLVLTLLLATVPLGGRAAAAATGPLCRFGLVDIQVADQCFAPGQINRAEKRMPVAPVRPVAVVTRIARLRLTELKLRDPLSPLELQYLFGTIAGGRNNQPDLTMHKTRYVLVGEVVGHTSLAKPRLFRYRMALGGTAYWEWSGNLPCRNLSLDILANVRGSTVWRIGNALLQEGCGK